LTTGTPHPDTLDRLRRALLLILAASLFGVGTELLLLEHVEDPPQYIPLALIAVSLLVIGWHAVAKSRASVQVLRVLMLGALVSGPVGIILHFRGNAEFELEMTPGLGGLALIKAAVLGATPLLAPGTMSLLGVLGLLYTWRHPAAD
jgi:hypothetical protein